MPGMEANEMARENSMVPPLQDASETRLKEAHVSVSVEDSLRGAFDDDYE